MKRCLAKIPVGVLLGSIFSTLVLVGKSLLDQNNGVDAMDRIFLFPVAFGVGTAVAVAGTALALKWLDRSGRMASLEAGVVFGLSALGLFLEGVFEAGVYLVPATCLLLGWLMLVCGSRRVRGGQQ